MILKICRLLPDMYIIIAVMGSCFTGAKATSHAFFSLRVSICAVVGGARADEVFETVVEDLDYLW